MSYYTLWQNRIKIQEGPAWTIQNPEQKQYRNRKKQYRNRQKQYRTETIQKQYSNRKNNTETIQKHYRTETIQKQKKTIQKHYRTETIQKQKTISTETLQNRNNTETETKKYRNSTETLTDKASTVIENAETYMRWMKIVIVKMCNMIWVCEVLYWSRLLNPWTHQSVLFLHIYTCIWCWLSTHMGAYSFIIREWWDRAWNKWMSEWVSEGLTPCRRQKTCT